MGKGQKDMLMAQLASFLLTTNYWGAVPSHLITICVVLLHFSSIKYPRGRCWWVVGESMDPNIPVNKDININNGFPKDYYIERKGLEMQNNVHTPILKL